MDALEGLTIVDLSRGFAGALVSLLFADYGAEVLRIEPPEGDPLRAEVGFPLWQRSKKSVVLDLESERGRDHLRRLALRADVLLETWRPGVAERLGVGYDALAAQNPGLVYTSITGFGRRGPYAAWKGYEGIVLAKLGGMAHVAGMAPRSGPAFPAVPYASFGAAQGALIGTLAALYERERTGLGQRVDTSLVQGIAAHDPWEWFLRIVCEKFPQAYTPAPPYSERGVPSSGFAFRLLVCLTKDGRWLQFSQTSPHLFREFMEVLGLAWMFDDPAWASAPDFDTEEQRERFWERMLEAARQRTHAEWDEVFAAHPNVWAELFRTTREALDHPQMRHNGHVIAVEDPVHGAMEQLAPLVRLAATPGRVRAPAPALGAHGAEVLASLVPAATRRADADAGAARPPALERSAFEAPAPRAAAAQAAFAGAPQSSERGARRGPLSGVTILELGLWYAAPYGTALLADLGARVIKIEPLGGEPMRHVMPVPDAAAVKVLQGKESVALDLERPEGRAIVQRLARRADLVLMSYRAGVAERLGVDAATLRRENPRLVYLAAPGYGTDGPCARKPAFAPTIGAAIGIGLLQAGPSIPHGPALSLDEIKPASIRLNYAAQAPGNADGCAALGVGTALALGLLARERTGTAQEMLTSMLLTTAYAVSADVLPPRSDAPGRAPDAQLFGLSALYRLYETSEGWVFLAAPKPREWTALCEALLPAVRLADDARFRTPSDRAAHEGALAEALGEAFRARTARDWEAVLVPRGVACAEVVAGPVARAVFYDPIGRDAGHLTEVEHPTFGSHRRLQPIAALSRTPGAVAPAPTLGMHTEPVLRELGLSDAEIGDLAARGVVALAR
jgi:crotonobetainyl-CoA:carnitine CoA-transferase CaiB-like acyl-CoA transferase